VNRPTSGAGPPLSLAVREHGVAMAHQHDVAARVGAAVLLRPIPGHRGAQAIAVLGLRQRLDRDAVPVQEIAHHPAHGVDAGLVVAAAVDVHHAAQQVHHGAVLGGEPGGDGGFRRLDVHGCSFGKRASAG